MSYTRLIYHIVFRTKDSIPSINEEHEALIYRYIWGLLQKRKCVLYRIGGMPNHIHMLLQMPSTEHIPDLMRDIKTATHYFIKSNMEKFPLFEGWGKSYCAISVSPTEMEHVVTYIRNQKTHHSSISFEDEYIKLLKENGVDYEERYVMKNL